MSERPEHFRRGGLLPDNWPDPGFRDDWRKFGFLNACWVFTGWEFFHPRYNKPKTQDWELLR